MGVTIYQSSNFAKLKPVTLLALFNNLNYAEGCNVSTAGINDVQMDTVGAYMASKCEVKL